MALDIYQAVTDRIIELLDRGTVPWRHPIRGAGGLGLPPTNLASGHPYRGINTFLLATTAWTQGYGSPYWLTFRQAGQRGGHVRKGEKGSLVIFWKRHATTDKQTGEDITIPILRQYTVFNTDQCAGVGMPTPGVDQTEPLPFEPLEEASNIAGGYADGPRVEHRGARAFYRPREDLVRMPEPDRFLDRESYYATLFHELVHSTGHSSRLNRGLDESPPEFGSPVYSREELIAEMGSAFLAAAAGIGPATIEQSAAYIDGWRKKLSGNPKLVVQAAGAGQKAADWIMGISKAEPPGPE